MLVVSSESKATGEDKTLPIESTPVLSYKEKQEEKETEREIQRESEAQAREEHRNEERLKKHKDSYYRLKKNLTNDANNTNLPKKRRTNANKALDKLIQNEGKKWGDPDAS